MKPLEITPQEHTDNSKPGIYMIYCAASGKAYIGQSKNPQKRLYQHKWELNKERHPNQHLQNSYSKHGKAYFNFIVLGNFEKSELTAKEGEYLDMIDKDLRYNMQKVTEVHDRVITDEYRASASRGQIERYKKEEAHQVVSECQKERFRKSPMTEEHKKKISEGNKVGQKERFKKNPVSEETKKKMSVIKKQMSEETRKKMSDSAKERAKRIMPWMNKVS